MCAWVCSVVSASAAPWTVAHPAPLSIGFPRQEYWSGLPFPTPGESSWSRIEPTSLASPALAGGFFTTVPPGKPGLFNWYKLRGGQGRNPGKGSLGLVLQQVGVRTDNRLCLFPEKGVSWSLKWGKGRSRSRGLAGGVTWVVCPPPCWCCVQGSFLLLLLEPQQWQLDFGLFVSYCSKSVPNAHACSYF